MKILGLGSKLVSEGVLGYTVTCIAKKFIALQSNSGGFVQFTRETFERMLDDNVFVVVRL